MANYKVLFSRELTDEEAHEVNDILANSDDDYEFEYTDDDDDEFIYSDDESEFDLGGEASAIEDIELFEMRKSIDAEFFDDDVFEEIEVEVETEEEMPIEPNRGAKYEGQGKTDKTVWWSMPCEEQKKRTELMKKNREESSACSIENFVEKKDAFIRLFPAAIVETIVLETNRKANMACKSQEREDHESKRVRTWLDTNADEMYAFLGILLHIGAEKANLVQAKDLFHKSNMPFYRAVMSLDRFEQLCRFLRFDDSRTRINRLREDKLAPIRHVWNLFQTNLTSSFIPSKELCIDEQLVTTRNRCSFRQYIPSKPGKYGIKIFWAVDSKTNYPVSAEIYLGMQPNNKRSCGISHELVMRLCDRYLNIGTNITMDNFFTSYPLAKELAEKNTTLVGTIRSNKRELPKPFTSAELAKKRGSFTSAFCFSDECELVSYTNNTHKNVLLLSTAHATEEIDSKSKKPVVILDYNAHKGGVDTFDKMLRGFSCKRKSNRWPMVIFYNMVDVAAFSAFRLYELCHPNWNKNKSEKRKIFIKELAFDLARKHLENRCKGPLKKSVRLAMDLIGFNVPKMTTAPPTMPEIQVKFDCKYNIFLLNMI